MATSRLISVRFEVFGKVQGVFFRKNTQKVCVQNNLVGWVKNTSKGTVVGVVQGQEEDVSNIKQWLSHTGSPKSRIDRCEFTGETSIEHSEYSDFSIIRKK